MSRFADATSADVRSVPIVLASGSPRRLELVERIGYEPEVVVSDVPERKLPEESGEAYTARLAEQKAEDVAEQLAETPDSPDWLLAADTVVVLEDRVLEKPEDESHAVEMLTAMADRWHRVWTSFCWWHRRSGERFVESVSTDVRLRDVSEDFLERYVATGEPLDKAGAYGIQEFGSMMVKRLRGSYFNVVGLPICEVVEVLETSGTLEIHPLHGGDEDVRHAVT